MDVADAPTMGLHDAGAGSMPSRNILLGSMLAGVTLHLHERARAPKRQRHSLADLVSERPDRLERYVISLRRSHRLLASNPACLAGVPLNHADDKATILRFIGAREDANAGI